MPAPMTATSMLRGAMCQEVGDMLDLTQRQARPVKLSKNLAALLTGTFRCPRSEKVAKTSDSYRGSIQTFDFRHQSPEPVIY